MGDALGCLVTAGVFALISIVLTWWASSASASRNATAQRRSDLLFFLGMGTGVIAIFALIYSVYTLL